MDAFLFGLIVLCTQLIEALTGFGATVLGLPMAIPVIGVKAAVPLLNTCSMIVCTFLSILKRKEIQWKEFFKIMAFVLVGMPLGIYLFSQVPDTYLKKVLAVFMIVISARALYLIFFSKKERKPAPKSLLLLTLVAGGIIHGAFGCGGPLITLYTAKAMPEKGQFRATMCMIWSALGVILLWKNIQMKLFTPDVLTDLLIALPFLIGGIAAGMWLHGRVRNEHFSRIIYIVLLLGGVAMLFG